jgi:putative membrane protein
MIKVLLKGKILLMLLIAMGVATSCDDDDDDEGTRLTVQEFMQQAAASDMFEIQTGNMADQKGTMAQVKTFGQMLVTDHTKSSNEMKALASQKNVTLPTTLPADKMQKVTTLQNQNGTAFDRQFAQMQVEAHEEAIDLYEKADNDITDTQLQAFIDKTLPVLRMHLEEAQELEDMTN